MLPAQAAPTAALTLSKTIDKDALSPGETAVYEMVPGCDSPTTLCEGAVLTDTVPAPLVIEDINVVGGTSTVEQDGSTMTVRFADVHENGATGLRDGSTVQVYVTVRLPQSTPPERNGDTLLNVAEVTAENADPKEATAPVTLEVPVTVAAAVQKSWGVDSVPAGSDQAIPLQLTGIANASNIGASSLTLTEPSGSTNPFETVEVTGLGPVTLPQGADEGQLIALTADGEVAGEVAVSPALPAGVDLADIVGLRAVFSDSTGKSAIIAGGTGGAVTLQTQLRSDVDADLSRVDNQAAVVASTSEGDSEPATAEDSFAIAPASYSVQATKTIAPATVVEGGDATVTIGAANRSNQPLDTLTLTEPAEDSTFFDEGVELAGFTTTTWPTGAASGTLTVGGTDYPLTQDEGDVVWPADLPADIDAFVVEFAGTFVPGAAIGAAFDVTGTTEGTYTNTVTADGSSGSTQAAADQADADLTVVAPHIEYAGHKALLDSTGATPAVIEGAVGDTLDAVLQGWIAGSTNVPVHEIVLTDVFPADFDKLTATSLTIENALGATDIVVERLVDGEWQSLEAAATEGATYELPDGTDGVRVTYRLAEDRPGFPQGSGNQERVWASVDFVVAEELEDDATLTNVLLVGDGEWDGENGTGGSSDDSATVDKDLVLGVTKQWSPDRVVITPDDTNPTSALRLTAQNNLVYAVDHLAISEPGAGTDAFELVDITGISASLHGGAEASDARLTLRFADGTSADLEGPAALSPVHDDWDDVVGFDFAFESLDEDADTIPRGASFQVMVSTELRSETRTDGTAVETALAGLEPAYTVTNAVDAAVGRDTATRTGSAAHDLGVETVDSVDITADVTKTFTPDTGSILQPGGAPSEVGVQLALMTGGDQADRITFEDVDPTFWNAFDLQSWQSIDVTSWAAASQVELELSYLVGADYSSADGDVAVSGGQWVDSGPYAVTGEGLPMDFGTGLPDGVAPGDVQGLRLTLATTDHSVLPGVWNPTTQRHDYSVDLVVNPRAELRTGEASSTDGETVNPGEETASTVVNDLTGTADRLGGNEVSGTDDATFTLVPGETRAEVAKTDNGSRNTSTTAGGAISYTLRVTNTGSAPIVDPVITDLLPADDHGPQLLFSEDGDVDYAVSPKTSAMTTDPAEIELAVDHESAQPSVAISFPEGSVLMPGETYTVTLPVVVRAGHQPATGIVNTLVVTSGDPELRETDEALVNVLSGQAYQSRKLVREVVPADAEPTGNRTADGAPEGATCTDFGDGFVRYPCVAETAPGGSAEWQITVTNTGNVTSDSLEIIDILPWVGDKHVVPSLSAFDRGSQWSPTLTEIAEPVAAQGTTVTTMYLLGDPGECVPSGPAATRGRAATTSCGPTSSPRTSAASTRSGGSSTSRTAWSRPRA